MFAPMKRNAWSPSISFAPWRVMKCCSRLGAGLGSAAASKGARHNKTMVLFISKLRGYNVA